MTFVSPEPNAFADAGEKKYAVTRNLGELLWIQYPG
ncbi:cupin, partial [Lactobacillus crispatus]